MNAEQNVPVSGVPIHTHLANNILSKDRTLCITALFARSRARSLAALPPLLYMPDSGMVS
jgi:hypothetical protein